MGFNNPAVPWRELERVLSGRPQGDGGACHTGARSCFYRTLPLGEPVSPDMRMRR
jgi:hypothetical protein